MPEVFKNYWPYLTFFILAGIAFLPARLFISFYREPNKIAVKSYLTLWFIPFRFNMVNPVTKAFWNLSANRPWRMKPPQEIKAGEINWIRFSNRISLFKKVSSQIWKGANRFFKKVGKPVRIRELNLYTEIASEDAAQTALLAGAFWALHGFLYTLLANKFNIQHSRNNWAVIPKFQCTNFLLVDYSCIFQFRLGHIIIVIYQILRSSAEIYSLIRRASK